jgi:hypothetical protein
MLWFWVITYILPAYLGQIFGQKWSISAHLFLSMPTFKTGFWVFGEVKKWLWSKIFGQNPLLKAKVGTLKPSIYAGLRTFWSKTHFFL